MKLEIPKGTIKINSYEYRSRTDIEEAVIPDSVEIIGEGAFKDCRSLTKLTVGKGVKQINLYAFDGIGKKLDIVWLSNLAYKSPFIKILPPFEDIDSICAPKRAFAKAGLAEKRALVCGYILHPEYEQEYSEDAKKEYLEYIHTDFENHLNELCDRDMILKIFLACYERNF